MSNTQSAGRKPNPAGRLFNSNISFRINKCQGDAWEAEARKVNKTTSQWLRDLADAEVKRRSKESAP